MAHADGPLLGRFELMEAMHAISIVEEVALVEIYCPDEGSVASQGFMTLFLVIIVLPSLSFSPYAKNVAEFVVSRC